MSKDFERMEDSNRSANPSIHDVSEPSRRVVLLGGIGALTVGALAPWLVSRAAAAPAAGGRPLIGFKSVQVSEKDAVVVPEGYEAVAFAAWGEPVGVPGNMPAFRWDASNSAADQAVQMGMHHDGIHYFPIDGSSTHGLLVMNHEYTDDGLLFPDGKKNWTAEKVAKAQAAHGIGVIEIELRDGRWQVVRPSTYARRYTARTPIAVSGPAAGHALMKTAADPDGRTVLGTLNNCGSGMTPWGTYLSAEENWALLLRWPGPARCRPAPLGPAQERPLALGRTRSALRCEAASERVPSVRMDRRNRPVRSGQRAGQAHCARSRREGGRVGRDDPR